MLQLQVKARTESKRDEQAVLRAARRTGKAQLTLRSGGGGRAHGEIGGAPFTVRNAGSLGRGPLAAGLGYRCIPWGKGVAWRTRKAYVFCKGPGSQPEAHLESESICPDLRTICVPSA